MTITRTTALIPFIIFGTPRSVAAQDQPESPAVPEIPTEEPTEGAADPGEAPNDSAHASDAQLDPGEGSASPAASQEPDADLSNEEQPTNPSATQNRVEPETENAPLEENAKSKQEQGEPVSEAGAEGWGDLSDMGETDETPLFQSRLYGFINAYVEKVAKTPAIDSNGDTIWETNPYEWDVLNFNIMLQGAISGRYKYFFNLVGNGAGSNTEDVSIGVRNAWVEVPIVPQYLNVRAGKTYRRFGLYNEILDAVPTFIGIEPPELFDKDHLMLTRTTNLMVHGAYSKEDFTVNYSLTTGNDERSKDTLPVGADLSVEWGGWLKLGTSFYYSGPDATPSRAVGEGSPRGGVLNWMASDEYTVAGGYLEARLSALLVQVAYWTAHHNAVRDPDQVALLADADLNERQLQRFFENGDPTGPVNVDATYRVQTAYSRLGYEFLLGSKAAITPYAQFDFFENPETILNKDFGGDNEAGLADDGKFFKYTLGAVIRPIPQIALKLDASAHQQKFNGETEIYPEGRCSLSYLWEL